MKKTGPQVKADRYVEALAATLRRKVGRHLVYFPTDGKPFILSKRVDGRVRSRPGEIGQCPKCSKESFHPSNGRKNSGYCSKECSSDGIRKTKHTKTLERGGPKRDTLDRWFSLIVRSAGICANCGRTIMLQCAHILSRRYYGVRFAFDNAMCLCSQCHLRFTYQPIEWEDFVVGRIGESAFLDLKRRAREFVGPIDRVSIAKSLYALAFEKGLRFGDFPAGSGWEGFLDPNAEGRRGDA